MNTRFARLGNRHRLHPSSAIYKNGLVGGWRGYGRSNDESSDKRIILPDYSGNGRDIQLYNFAFAGMSGYGGYPISLLNSGGNNITAEKTATKATYTLTADNSITIWVPKSDYSRCSTKVRINASPDIISKAKIVIYNDDWTTAYSQDIAINAIAEIEKIPDEYIDDSEAYKNYIYFVLTPVTGSVLPSGTSFSIEIFPNYPGALVSDGIDDYGQCVKGFALPDDYTVVAIRKIIQSTADCLVAKTKTANSGAFIFDYSTGGGYSYGAENARLKMPALFSYQTKTSYNGQTLNVGTATDTDEDKLTLFTFRPNDYRFIQAALYDLRIYDHSLTAEELQTVKDEMMADYENATGGGIADITYVADWDAKDRSNDEEEPMRSQWIDKKTGKVINLSNYSFSQMSGWNGYAEDFNSTTVAVQSDITDHIVSHTVTSTNNIWIWNRYSMSSINTIASMRVKITGVSTISATLRYYYIPAENTATRYFIDINSDGIYTLPSSVKYTGEGSHNVGLYLINLTEASIGKTVKVEQLPLYPGALVSDGVDDIGSSQDAINENIGSFIAHGVFIDTPANTAYMFNLGRYATDGRMFLYREPSGVVHGGSPDTIISSGSPYAFAKTPANPSRQLRLNTQGDGVFCQCALFRLIFIKEQLDDAQLEFLTWKVGKEYRDWCKEKGYDYAIPEMTENATN